MSSSNTCDFSLHSHSTSNCKCSSSSPYYSHLTQTRPIISFYFSKTVPVLQFLIFATVLTDFAKRLFYSNSTCTSCSLLLKSCCSFWMVAFFSVWTRVKSLEASCRYSIQQNVKMIVTILQDLSRSIWTTTKQRSASLQTKLSSSLTCVCDSDS